MRTVRFTFTGAADDARVVAEQILQAVTRGGSVDVQAELLMDGKRVIGIRLAGEHELVSIASERVRKALKARSIPYREEDASQPTAGETNAQSILDNITTRKPPAPPAPGAEEGEEEEYEEYDLEELTRAEYGQYPLTNTARLRDKVKRKQEQDEIIRAVREQMLPEHELGLARRKPLSAEERRKLAFARGMKAGVAFYRMGLQVDAERNLADALKVNKSDPEVHFYLGLVHDQLGRADLAERHFKRAIALDPEVGSNHFYLANILQKQGKFDKAVAEYKKAIERDPDVPIVYNNLAWVFYQQADYERSLRAFETSISMDPDLPFAHNGIACVYQELGGFTEAISEFKKAIELYPDYAAAHLKLGWCLLQVGDVARAIEAFKAVLESSEDGEYALSANYSLGHSYLAMGHLLEAQEAFQKVVSEEDDEFFDAILHLGIIQLRLGFAAPAVALLRKYLRKAGDNVSEEAWRYLATAYFQADQYAAALRACHRALQHDGNDPDVYELMGQIAGAQEKWTTAERHLRKALDLNRENASAWFHLGWVYENKGDRAQATQAYRTAIQRDPEAADAYTALGRLFSEEGKRDEALVLYEKALELSPADVGILNNLGWLYAQIGDFEDALSCYQKALGIEPESTMIRCNVGALYLQMGRRDDAERELRRVVQLDSDRQATANAHYFLGLVAKARQNPKKVIEHMELALRHDNDLGAAWFRLGEVLLEEGDLGGARRALERYLDLEPQGEFAGTARQYVLERLAGVTGSKSSPLGPISAPRPPARATGRKKTVRPRVRRVR